MYLAATEFAAGGGGLDENATGCSAAGGGMADCLVWVVIECAVTDVSEAEAAWGRFLRRWGWPMDGSRLCWVIHFHWLRWWLRHLCKYWRAWR